MKLIIGSVVAALVIGFLICLAILPYGIHKRPPTPMYVTWPSMKVFSFIDSLSGQWPRFIRVGSDNMRIDSQTPIGSLPVCEYEASFENIYWFNGVRYTNPSRVVLSYQGLFNSIDIYQEQDSVVVISQPSQTSQQTKTLTAGVFVGAGLSTDWLPYPEAVGFFNYKRFLLLGRGGFYPERNALGELKYVPKANAGAYFRIL